MGNYYITVFTITMGKVQKGPQEWQEDHGLRPERRVPELRGRERRGARPAAGKAADPSQPTGATWKVIFYDFSIEIHHFS